MSLSRIHPFAEDRSHREAPMHSHTRLFCLIVLAILLSTSALVSQQTHVFRSSNAVSAPRPYGIYAIGQASAAGIRSHPFVDGFVMRVDWSVIEPQRDMYDFSSIDAVVRRLDTLGQSLTLDVFRMKTPSYIMQTPGVQSHILRLNRDSFYTAVPWDAIALERFESLHAALGAHRVWSIRDNAALALRDHPVLRQIDATPIGTNGIRDLNHSLTSHPTYSRTVFVDAIVRTAEIVRTHFPRTFCFVALFGIQDDITTPRLSDAVRDALLQRVNTSSGYPMLGFFQENLACSGPLANNSNPLYAVRDSTFTMYQMLQSWRVPFLDSTKTDVCKTDSTGPDIAMLKAMAVTNGMYFELYVSDLDFPGYAAMFQRMHDSLARLNEIPTAIDRVAETNMHRHFQLREIYPHPFSAVTTIRYYIDADVPGNDGPAGIHIFDLFGRRVAGVPISETTPGLHELHINGSVLPCGMYVLRIHTGAYTESRKITVER